MEKVVHNLQSIQKQLSDLDKRLERLEGKTDDIHHYVPFVGWLERQGRRLAYFPGLAYFRPMPRIVEATKEETKCNKD